MQQEIISPWHKPQRPSPVIFLTGLVDLVKESASYVVLLVAASLLGKNSENNEKQGTFKYYLLGLLVAVLLFKVQKLLAWFFTRYWVEADKVIITKGIFVKSRVELPVGKIQTVQIKQNLLHRFTKTCSLTMDTAGSSTPEFVVDAIKLSIALELQQWLKANKQAGNNEVGYSLAASQQLPAFPVQYMDAIGIIKLSLSENHLRSLIIILAFVAGKMHELADQLGLYKDNTIDEQMNRLQPGIQAISVLVIASLLVAIGFSVVQVVFRYFNYKVLLQQSAYQMEWGLFTRHHKTMAFNKVEYLTWSANWLRSKMNLFILRLHSLSDPLAAQELQLQVPATNAEKLEQLIEPYHTTPQKLEPVAVFGIQNAYCWRRVLLIGIPVAAAAMLALWWGNALWWWWLPVGWLLYFTLAQLVFVKKYRLHLFENAVWISKGIWGQKHLFIKYEKLLHVSVHTSPWQRSHSYANLWLHLPAKVWKIPYLKLDEARQLADYFIFELEQSAD